MDAEFTRFFADRWKKAGLDGVKQCQTGAGLAFELKPPLERSLRSLREISGYQ